MQVLAHDDVVERVSRPHFRGLHHIVIASFSASNLFVFDLLRRNVVATVSGSLARDQRFWNEVLLPIAMGVLGATLGVEPVHCACLSDCGEGLLLAGASGAGKSTLAAALVQAGFSYLSDDWTFLCRKDGKLVAHGISPIVKLLPDAIRYFAGLGQHQVRASLNGELAYELSAADAFGATIIRRCKPRSFVFLERRSLPGSEFTSISAQQARDYIESGVERLPKQLAIADHVRARIIRQISRLSCWKFRYGGSPQFAAQEIRSFFCLQKQKVSV
jgi:hypothetical protein